MASEFERFFRLGVDCQPQMHMQTFFFKLGIGVGLFLVCLFFWFVTYRLTWRCVTTHANVHTHKHTHTKTAAAAYRYLYLGGTEDEREHIL